MYKLALEQLSYYYSVIKSDTQGLTTVEYAVAGALVAAVLVASFTELGDSVDDVISNLSTEICSNGNTGICD